MFCLANDFFIPRWKELNIKRLGKVEVEMGLKSNKDYFT